jgi:hypothetical protein
MKEQNTNIFGRGLASVADHRDHKERIRELNDHLRRTGRGGMVLLSCGVAALSVPTVKRLFDRIADFEDFGPDNDPHGEHDSGAVDFEGASFLWKIDYLDRARVAASPDPADPRVTVRVLTVMLAEEY